MERAIVYAADMPESYLEGFDGVYIGNEFCEKKIPSADELERLLAMCVRLTKKMTFLTPYVSDTGMEMLGRHLEILSASHALFEVVVNDWGFLNFLDSKKTNARVIAGRLLSARYMQGGHMTGRHAEAPLFPESFLRLLEEFDIEAVEFNALGQAQACAKQLEKIQVRSHLYHPFMYVTTSRYCSGANHYREYAHVPDGPCDRTCDHAYAVVRHNDSGHKAYLVGNTYFVMNAAEGPGSLSGISRLIDNSPWEAQL